MDKLLLASLDNLSVALTTIADILNKKQTKSATGAALESGDFSKDIKQISVGIKSIKADTEKILKSQNAILELSKKKSSEKKTPMEETGGDKKKESNLKKGVGTIILIAVAVLAIGMAFKLVGKIDFLSVIGLGLAIVIIAVAFEKVAKLNLSIKQAFIASLAMVMMSVAVMLSSWALGMIKPIGITQAITGILIAGLFTVLAFGLPKIVTAIDSIRNPIKTGIYLVLILPAISLGIAMSSWALSLVRPIGFAQAITAILIAGMFTVISYNLHKIAFGVTVFSKFKVSPFDLIKTMVAISAAITASSYVLGLIRPISFGQAVTGILIAVMFMVISFNLHKIALGVVAFNKTKVSPFDLIKVLVGIAGAIALSSWVLGLTRPIGIWQFLTALGITILFAIMSYFMDKLAIGVVIVEKVLGKGKIFLIPLVLLALATAIMLSSHVLSKTKDITFMMLFKILAIGLILALLTVVFVPAVFVLGKMSVSALIKGTVAIVVIAAAIMVSSHILALGNYKKYPDWKWALGVGLAILAFAPGVVLLGLLAMADGGLSQLLGAVMVLIVATAIMATSHILAMGNYKKSPPILWTLGVLAVMVPFAIGMVALGMIAVTGIGAIALLLGAGMILVVAKAIVKTSEILSGGKYTGGPPVWWSLSTGLVMTGFGLAVLTLGSFIVGTLGLGYLALKAGSAAVSIIAQSIVNASIILQNGKYVAGPTKEWAKGVSIALGAFSPVYGMMMASGIMKLFGGSGVSPADFAAAIVTVSGGIITAAAIFADPKNKGTWIGGPSKAWAQGVGTAIGAFAPVFKVLQDSAPGLFSSGGPSVEDMSKAIMTISRGIVDAAKFFSNPEISKLFNTEGNYPSKKWGQGVGAALNAFAPVFKSMSEGSGWFTSGDDVIDGMVRAVSHISRALVNSARAFFGIKPEAWGAYPTTAWAKGVGASVKGFMGIVQTVKNLSLVDSLKVSIVISQIAGAARLLFSSKKYFGFKLDSAWVKSLSSNVIPFATLAKEVDKLLGYDEKISIKSGGFLGFGQTTTTTTVRKMKDVSIINRIISQMSDSARLLWSNKKFFEFKLDTSWIKSLTGGVIGYAVLINQLDRLLGQEIKKVSSGVFSTTTTTTRQMKDVSTINKIIAQMVLSASILHQNQKLFSYKLDLDWFSKLRSGLLQYVHLSRSIDSLIVITESWGRKEKGVWVPKYLTTRNMDMGGVNKVVNQMVSTAGILYEYRKLFSFKINPDYMKNVAANVMDYALLAKSLSLNSDKSSVMDEVLGLDPISRAASGMIKIASAYDKLASAIKGFSGALNSLDGGKVNMFRSLTGNLALLSAMDSNMFSNMLKVLESRSGVFANLLKQQAKAEGIGGKGVKTPGAAIQTTKAGVGKDGGEGAKDSRGETQLQKLDKIVLLLSNINNVAGVGGTLDTYLMAKQTDTSSDDIGKKV